MLGIHVDNIVGDMFFRSWIFQQRHGIELQVCFDDRIVGEIAMAESLYLGGAQTSLRVELRAGLDAEVVFRFYPLVGVPQCMRIGIQSIDYSRQELAGCGIDVGIIGIGQPPVGFGRDIGCLQDVGSVRNREFHVVGSIFSPVGLALNRQ